MKFGIVPINVSAKASPEAMAALAQKAETLGIESAWTFEHVIVPVAYESKYPYSASGKMAASPETEFVDPLIALGFVAAHTKRIKLATGVNILPQANPLLLAKQAASIDLLSGGRLLLGLGVGWLREEFAALNAPFERRGARADDYLEAMKKIWSGEVVEHESEFLHWHGFKSHPRPAQRPHPPLIIGGDSEAAMRRVARYGDGWFAVSAKPDVLAEKIASVRKQAAALGRDPERIEISLFWTRFGDGPAAVRQYEEIGVSRLITPLATLDKTDFMAGVEKLADQVIAKL